MSNAFKLNGHGCTRHVILVGHYAIKVPRMNYGWRMFLNGLLANMQECAFSAAKWSELCPVLWAAPGGWMVVMPRVRVMTDAEFEVFDREAFIRRPNDDGIVPAEAKSDSFGWMNGRVVAIDYGS